MTYPDTESITDIDAGPSAPAGTSAVARWQWVQSRVFDQPDLTSAEICVALVLASYVNDRTQDCFPRIETIARAARLCERKVRQALNRLVKLGLIVKISRAVGHLRNRNAYQLVGLSAKPAPHSPKPARDAGVKAAPDAGSYKKNTDKEGNTDGREQRCSPSDASPGLGATVLPAVDDQCLILAREWQRLCSQPWTLANACLRVSEAVQRVGLDAVHAALTGLRQEGKKPSRLAMLDILDGLMPEVCVRDETPVPAPIGEASDPAEWREICDVIAQGSLPGCRHPRAWLSQIRASITGNALQLVASNRCVRDTAQNHLLSEITRQAARRGLVTGGVSCLN
ncbi:helix-turn-helix domain-containing protein [Thalassospira sp.]|uniref:helix-turn-helix domain-containing protein n=1 Tax=Thalassospira sp. TaxID=1912094 RepID=UPI0027343177|nr:helix-turn-helix domain-containing protein [Thalassospira sp.]MDP2697154.1 helix-turn-helix domain-containing protein [Thalassospira sp.]